MPGPAAPPETWVAAATEAPRESLGRRVPEPRERVARRRVEVSLAEPVERRAPQALRGAPARRVLREAHQALAARQIREARAVRAKPAGRLTEESSDWPSPSPSLRFCLDVECGGEVLSTGTSLSSGSAVRCGPVRGAPGRYFATVQALCTARSWDGFTSICGSVAPDASTTTEDATKNWPPASRAQAVRCVCGRGASPKQHHSLLFTGQNWNLPSRSVQASARCRHPGDESFAAEVHTTTVAPLIGWPAPSTILPENAPR